MHQVSWLVGLLIIGAPMIAHAQLWSGILSPTRATDWRNAGVQGGIPNRTTICATLNPGATATQINNAISACPSGQVVFLNAGTYTLGSGISFQKSNVTLRGAGANQTKLIINGSVGGCGLGLSSAIRLCSGGTNLGGGGGSPDHTATWTAGYAQSTTVVTLSNVTGLSVGNVLFLDQLNDGSDGWPAAGDIFVCEGTGCSNQGGNNYARSGRDQVQVVTVTAINGNNVTISPGLHMPNWRSSQSPGAWWGNTVIKNSGIEDLTVDFTSSGVPGIVIANALNCWTKGIRWLKMNATGSEMYHVMILNGARITTRDSYFYGATVAANTQYTYTPHVSSNLLFENNILHHNPSPVVANDPESGSVISYNYFDDSFYTGAGVIQHNTGDAMNLFEGNNLSNFTSDVIHGTHHFLTYFRNHVDGYAHNPGGVDSNAGFEFRTHSRFFNVIGNVIGHSHFTTYETLNARNGDAIFDLGWMGDASGTPVSNDSNVNRTVMRWGNWDNVNNGTRFAALEVPSALTNFANLIPASQTLPPSFYLSARPAWWSTPWGTPAWPPIGPDVTGGNISGYAGHAHKIPARLCFENSAIDSAYGSANVLVFNASACYIQGDQTIPSSPPGPPVLQ